VSFGIPVRNGLGIGLLASTTLSTRRGISTPALSLNFLTGSLDGRITFTRSTTATFVGSNGLIQTAAINAPRFDFNPSTLLPLGLLMEEGRTNLMLQSEDFSVAITWAVVSATVTGNTTVAPDGTTTGDTIAASTTASYVSQNVTFTGDADKTYSVFVKAGTATVTRLVLRDTTAAVNRGGVNLTWTAGVPAGVATEGTLQGIDAYPNGWYRVRMLAVGVVAANVNQFRFSPDTAVGTNNTIFWGAQTENGAFATSYIPTTTVPVPRAAELALMTGTNFSSWYNVGEGTFVAAYDQLIATSNQVKTIASASDGSILNRIWGYVGSSPAGAPTMLVTTAGTAQATVINAVIGSNVTVKTAFAYKVNDFAITTNSGTVAIDPLGTVPTGLTSLGLGATFTNINHLNGHLRTLAYYAARLTNAQMQALTV
jgi:uncharacterized membrane protein YeaQ/YmgE (transglycosylase-associated protein family)